MKTVSLLFWCCCINPVGLSHSILFLPPSGTLCFRTLVWSPHIHPSACPVLLPFAVVSVLFLELCCSRTSICLFFLLAFLVLLNCLYSFSCGLMNFLEMTFSVLHTSQLSVIFELVTVCFQTLTLWWILILMIQFWCLHAEEGGNYLGFLFCCHSNTKPKPTYKGNI